MRANIGWSERGRTLGIVSFDVLWALLPLAAIAAGFGLYLMLIFHAYDDMQKRDQPGWLYALALWFMPFVGLFAWWYGRRRYPLRETAELQRASD